MNNGSMVPLCGFEPGRTEYYLHYFFRIVIINFDERPIPSIPPWTAVTLVEGTPIYRRARETVHGEWLERAS